jgi:hypothetical protein
LIYIRGQKNILKKPEFQKNRRFIRGFGTKTVPEVLIFKQNRSFIKVKTSIRQFCVSTEWKFHRGWL